MTELENTLLKRLDALEAEVAVLRASVRERAKPKSQRVTALEIAQKFGVSDRTVRNMDGDFAFLRSIAQRTSTNRLYWKRTDYENALRRRESKTKGLIRRSK